MPDGRTPLMDVKSSPPQSSPDAYDWPHNHETSASSAAGVRVMPGTSECTFLPWERSGGPTEGVGICLSGGGVRAATFSLGVLQALQEGRGLLFGPSAARYLSAVSGGSYIAATYVLGGRHRSIDPGAYKDRAPLAHGTPEEAHVLANGKYLRAGLLSIFLLLLVNLFALTILFVAAGTLVANFAHMPALLPDNWRGAQKVFLWFDKVPPLLAGAALIPSYWLLIWIWYRDESIRTGMVVFGLVILSVLLCGPVISFLAGHGGWQWWVIAIPLGLIVAWFVSTKVAKIFGIVGPVATLLNAAAIVSPRLLGLRTFSDHSCLVVQLHECGSQPDR